MEIWSQDLHSSLSCERSDSTKRDYDQEMLDRFYSITFSDLADLVMAKCDSESNGKKMFKIFRKITDEQLAITYTAVLCYSIFQGKLFPIHSLRIGINYMDHTITFIYERHEGLEKPRLSYEISHYRSFDDEKSGILIDTKIMDLVESTFREDGKPISRDEPILPRKNKIRKLVDSAIAFRREMANRF